MSKNKQGFTLIELLAVMVILAIIIVITTPIILKSIDEAKKGAFRNSVYGIIKTGEYNYSQQLLKTGKNKNMEYIYENEEESSPTNDNKLDYKGSKPIGGIIKINKKGEIALALHNHKWCALKKYRETKITLEKYTNDEECQLEKDDYILATDKDFEWVEEWVTEESCNSFWHYIGNDDYVEIPPIIQGEPVTNYYKMFNHTGVKGVKSDNPNITVMVLMFWENTAESLDLSELNISNIQSASNMFADCQATIGYAKTQADADIFNSPATGTPPQLVFVVKET